MLLARCVGLVNKGTSVSMSSSMSSSSSCSSEIDPPVTFEEYRTKQQLLPGKQQAPCGNESFQELQQPSSQKVFRDFTPLFEQLGILEPRLYSVKRLLGGRKWGKTTLGSAWLSYLRQEAHLFEGTAVEHKMRKEPLLGIHLDVSACSSMGHFVQQLALEAKRGMTIANVLGSWEPKLPSLDELESLNSDSLSVHASEILDDVSRHSKMKIALFIDECDSLNIRALLKAAEATDEVSSKLCRDQYNATNTFIEDFHTTLKCSDKMPFRFSTASSQLSIGGYWSGNNTITDVTHTDAMLGYTWPQIEQCFPTQLRWLEQLHGMTREQLRSQMEAWYGGHIWCRSRKQVFNPWCVHQFIRTGEFTVQCSSKAATLQLVKSPELLNQLVTSTGNKYIFEFGLVDVGLPRVPAEGLSDEGQKSLLVGAGILSIHPESFHSESVRLTVPNREAAAALKTLHTSVIAGTNTR